MEEAHKWAIEHGVEREAAKSIALTKTKNSRLSIESYKNILINGIDNLLKQNLKNYIGNDPSEFIISVLKSSIYKEGYTTNVEVDYDVNSKIAIINYEMPSPFKVPKIIKYNYNEALNKLN